MAATIRLSQQHSCSLDHLVGARDERRRYVKAERLCRLEINDEVELGWPDHRQLGWFFALEDTAGVDAELARYFRNIRPVAHQPACIGILAIGVDHGHGVPRG